LLEEFFDLGGERGGGLVIFEFFVGDAGVGIAGDVMVAHLVKGTDVVGHELGASGAIETD